MLETIVRDKTEKSRMLNIRGRAEEFPVWAEFKEIQPQARELARILLSIDNLTIATIHRGGGPFGFLLGKLLHRMRADFTYIDVPIIAQRTWNNELAAPAKIYADHVAPSREVFGRNVLVVDDILDSGETLRKVLKLVKGWEPATLQTAVLVTKGSPAADIEPSYSLFQFPASPPVSEKEFWFCGYGMDYDLKFRNLEDIIEVRYDMQMRLRVNRPPVVEVHRLEPVVI